MMLMAQTSSCFLLFGTCHFQAYSVLFHWHWDNHWTVFSSWLILLMLPMFAERQYVFVDVICGKKNQPFHLFQFRHNHCNNCHIFLWEWRIGWPLNMHVIHIFASIFPILCLLKCILLLLSLVSFTNFLLPSYIPFSYTVINVSCTVIWIWMRVW